MADNHTNHNHTNHNPLKAAVITALTPCVAELIGLGTDLLKQARESIKEKAVADSATRPLHRTLEQLRLKKEIAELERELHDPHASELRKIEAETRLVDAQASHIEAENRRARAAKAAKAAKADSDD